ncbi:MAG: YfhO family protein [Bacteroidetes bacterium]|nr:YfhO family protein [Bacteroidota bacterium]
MQFDAKKLIPHAIAVGIFLVVSLLYCLPATEGKVLNAHDNIGWKGMAQQSISVKEQTGKVPLWTNSLFSGMPGYQVALENSHQITFLHVSTLLTLGLPKPANFFFLACITFYLLGLALRLNPWTAILGAIAYAYSTYNPIIIGAGHDTKMLAMGYAPLAVAGLLLLFQKRYWLGSAAMVTGLALQLGTVHIQIVYYTLLLLAALTIGYGLFAYRSKEIKHFLKCIAIATIMGIIAFGSNAVVSLANWDYAKESMRGGASELKQQKDANVTAGGLDKDYAFKYSVGITETLTMFVPGLYGGSNGGNEYSSSAFADKLMEIGYPEDQALQNANGISYWGDQQPTSGPVYFGAALMVLFVFGLFLEKGWLKWSLLGAGLFGILLAWGKHVESINYFLFDYMPLYKKFRAPSMALVIPQLSFVLLAVLGLNQLLFGTTAKEMVQKAWKNTAITTGVIALLLVALYFSFDYTSPNDTNIRESMRNAMLQQMSQGKQPSEQMMEQAETFGKGFTTAIKQDRKSLFGSDLTRSIILMSLVLGVLWFTKDKKFNPILAAFLFLALTSFDLFKVDRRYLNENSFVEEGEFEQAFTETDADKMIKQDKGYFRVFNTTTDPFNESVTSYHHNSIGGYHPAKLQIYQDLIEYQISKNNMQVLNMLNTKYFILSNPQTGDAIAQFNPEAFGPVWLTKGIKFVPDAKAEMSALDNTNLRDTAVVQQKFSSKLSVQPVADSNASIRFVENKNDFISYEFNAGSPQFAVFSEVCYPRGWNAYIDDKKAEIIKTNYALRGLAIPAGKHQIVFRFEPEVIKIGNLLVMISSILAYIIVLAAFWMEWRKSKLA